MIAFLQGVLAEAWPMRAVVDVNGVGYEVNIPLSTYEKLPQPGAKVKLLTHLQVREDEHSLYGFYSSEERDLFKLLVAHVSGVGPKLALSILSGCQPSQFKVAVAGGDVAFLSKIKGLGKKTAERIIVELRDKLGVGQAWAAGAMPGAAGVVGEGSAFQDALLALMALGYKQPDAMKLLAAVPRDVSSDEMIRLALRQVSG